MLVSSSPRESHRETSSALDDPSPESRPSPFSRALVLIQIFFAARMGTTRTKFAAEVLIDRSEASARTAHPGDDISQECESFLGARGYTATPLDNGWLAFERDLPRDSSVEECPQIRVSGATGRLERNGVQHG